MDFMSRGNRPNQPVNQNGSANMGTNASDTASKSKPSNEAGKGLRIASVALLFCVAIVLLALVVYLSVGKPKRTSPGQFVDTNNLQAVFLNNGQVYFGNIRSLNDQYMRLGNIYYLRVNQTVQPNQTNNANSGNQDISLVKLGCELHGPADQMVISTSQVTFWENLKGDGQVTKAVADYVKQNPNGQKCQTASTSGTSTTPSTSNNKQ